MILQVSTGGRSGGHAAREACCRSGQQMASLAVGSSSFPTRVYEHSLDLVDWPASEMQKYDVKPEIEAFDLDHIFQAVKMRRDGRLKAPLYVRFARGSGMRYPQTGRASNCMSRR
ncbi:3-keto-5-aminohexanoate cleavage protein [Rhodovulum sulfidophilum]|uniref:3-keto-5-aminohexanoate cleavage protein n=1 Tax=Rhodovulum sulfidophilum TaxID=35806 RepID=UPI002277D1C4|nr:3-keto-5-aminohexanoate cleavage protein [Rhodovulum sulfidophilum]